MALQNDKTVFVRVRRVVDRRRATQRLRKEVKKMRCRVVVLLKPSTASGRGSTQTQQPAGMMHGDGPPFLPPSWPAFSPQFQQSPLTATAAGPKPPASTAAPAPALPHKLYQPHPSSGPGPGAANWYNGAFASRHGGLEAGYPQPHHGVNGFLPPKPDALDNQFKLPEAEHSGQHPLPARPSPNHDASKLSGHFGIHGQGLGRGEVQDKSVPHIPPKVNGYPSGPLSAVHGAMHHQLPGPFIFPGSGLYPASEKPRNQTEPPPSYEESLSNAKKAVPQPRQGLDLTHHGQQPHPHASHEGLPFHTSTSASHMPVTSSADKHMISYYREGERTIHRGHGGEDTDGARRVAAEIMGEANFSMAKKPAPDQPPSAEPAPFANISNMFGNDPHRQQQQQRPPSKAAFEIPDQQGQISRPHSNQSSHSLDMSLASTRPENAGFGNKNQNVFNPAASGAPDFWSQFGLPPPNVVASSQPSHLPTSHEAPRPQSVSSNHEQEKPRDRPESNPPPAHTRPGDFVFDRPENGVKGGEKKRVDKGRRKTTPEERVTDEQVNAKVQQILNAIREEQMAQARQQPPAPAHMPHPDHPQPPRPASNSSNSGGTGITKPQHSEQNNTSLTNNAMPANVKYAAHGAPFAHRGLPNKDYHTSAETDKFGSEINHSQPPLTHMPHQQLERRTPTQQLERHTPTQDLDRRMPGQQPGGGYPPYQQHGMHMPHQHIDRHTPNMQPGRGTPNPHLDRLTPTQQFGMHMPHQQLDRRTPNQHIDRRTPTPHLDRRTPTPHLDRHTPNPHLDGRTPNPPMDRLTPNQQLDRPMPKQSPDLGPPHHQLGMRHHGFNGFNGHFPMPLSQQVNEVRDMKKDGRQSPCCDNCERLGVRFSPHCQNHKRQKFDPYAFNDETDMFNEKDRYKSIHQKDNSVRPPYKFYNDFEKSLPPAMPNQSDLQKHVKSENMNIGHPMENKFALKKDQMNRSQGFSTSKLLGSKVLNKYKTPGLSYYKKTKYQQNKPAVPKKRGPKPKPKLSAGFKKVVAKAEEDFTNNLMKNLGFPPLTPEDLIIKRQTKPPNGCLSERGTIASSVLTTEKQCESRAEVPQTSKCARLKQEFPTSKHLPGVMNIKQEIGGRHVQDLHVSGQVKQLHRPPSADDSGYYSSNLDKPLRRSKSCEDLNKEKQAHHFGGLDMKVMVDNKDYGSVGEGSGDMAGVQQQIHDLQQMMTGGGDMAGEMGEKGQADMEHLMANTVADVPKCGCLGPDYVFNESVEGPYYTHLGAGRSVEAVRKILEKRMGVTGNAIRIEKVRYTGKEGKSTKGCPIAKWIIRRSSLDEKYLAVLRHRQGHVCETAWLIIGLVAWEGVPQQQADDLYEYLSTNLPENGFETERRCGTNEQKMCACQGADLMKRGASFSFGCSWSMYFNACKYARSQAVRKFKLKDTSLEEGLEGKLQDLATHVGPLYKQCAPSAHGNQSHFSTTAQDCRLGNQKGGPFSGVTACVDFCAHAHKDIHNMNNGSTVVVTLTRHRGLSKPDDEQLHVLPLYVLEPTDESESTQGQYEKIKKGALEVLHHYPLEARIRSHPLMSCKKRRQLNIKSPGRKKKGVDANARPQSPWGSSSSCQSTPKKGKWDTSMLNHSQDSNQSFSSQPGSLGGTPVKKIAASGNMNNINMGSGSDRPISYEELMSMSAEVGFEGMYNKFWNFFYTNGAFPPSSFLRGQARGWPQGPPGSNHQGVEGNMTGQPPPQQHDARAGRQEDMSYNPANKNFGSNVVPFDQNKGAALDKTPDIPHAGKDTVHVTDPFSDRLPQCEPPPPSSMGATPAATISQADSRLSVTSGPESRQLPHNGAVDLSATQSSQSNNISSPAQHPSTESSSSQHQTPMSAHQQMPSHPQPATSMQQTLSHQPATSAMQQTPSHQPPQTSMQQQQAATSVQQPTSAQQQQQHQPATSVPQQPATTHCQPTSAQQQTNTQENFITSTPHPSTLAPALPPTSAASSDKKSPLDMLSKAVEMRTKDIGYSYSLPTGADNMSAPVGKEFESGDITGSQNNPAQQLEGNHSQVTQNAGENGRAGADASFKMPASNAGHTAANGEKQQHPMDRQASPFPQGFPPQQYPGNSEKTSHFPQHYQGNPPQQYPGHPEKQPQQQYPGNTEKHPQQQYPGNPQQQQQYPSNPEQQQYPGNLEKRPPPQYPGNHERTFNGNMPGNHHPQSFHQTNNVNCDQNKMNKNFHPHHNHQSMANDGFSRSHQGSNVQPGMQGQGQMGHGDQHRGQFEQQFENFVNQGQASSGMPGSVSSSMPASSSMPGVMPNGMPGVASNTMPDPDVVKCQMEYNEEAFRDPNIGGVAIALCHGAVLFEVAKRELHATTGLKKPNRYHPTRISLVFYQHKKMNYEHHGMFAYAKKLENMKKQKMEKMKAEYGYVNVQEIENSLKGGKKRKLGEEEKVKEEFDFDILKSSAAHYRYMWDCNTKREPAFTTNTASQKWITPQPMVTGPYQKWV